MSPNAQRKADSEQYIRIARVSVGATNKDRCGVIDSARRQLDYLGKPGIMAKTGQTDKLFLRRGYLDFSFATLGARQKYVDRVEEHGDKAVVIKLMKRAK